MKPYNYKASNAIRLFYIIIVTLQVLLSYVFIVNQSTTTMKLLKGFLMTLVLLFVTPGSIEPPLATSSEDSDSRKRRIVAECTACGFVTDTEGGVGSHQCSAKVCLLCLVVLGIWRKYSAKTRLMYLFLWPAKSYFTKRYSKSVQQNRHIHYFTQSLTNLIQINRIIQSTSTICIVVLKFIVFRDIQETTSQAPRYVGLSSVPVYYCVMCVVLSLFVRLV